MPETDRLSGWMHFVLKFAGGYNILAGIAMMTCYHEGFQMLGVAKPDFVMPIQLVGLLVLLFGVGYLLVDREPYENRNVLLLGLLSKALGPLLAVPYIVSGVLPAAMLAVLFFADTIYLLPFWLIYQKLGQDRERRNVLNFDDAREQKSRDRNTTKSKRNRVA